MRIDAHQHFWRFNEAEYGWISAHWPILREDYLPIQLRSHLQRHGFAGSIAVQARQTLEESDWLLELGEQNDDVLGVVGWVDLCDERVEAEIERLSVRSKFKGVRHIVQDEPDDRFLLRPEFVRGVRLLSQYELVYDVLVYPRQLPAAVEFCKLVPEQSFVLDHIAKPHVPSRELEPWARHLRALAALPNVTCKVSGLITEADWSHWSATDLEPFLDVVLEAFGPSRLMYGSDWPVCLLAGEYDQVYNLAAAFASRLSAPEQRAFFGETAREVYGL